MKKFQKIKPYIINTIIIIAIFIITLIITKTSPFGNNILGKSESISQYKPMLYNFITTIKNGVLETYSFNNGLGNPFIFNFTYYLISPLNLIGIFFKNGDTMYLSIIIIKIIFTSILTTYYAKKHNCSDYTSFIATISYVYSGWFLAYYYNITWLDTFMIFPLFQYGLEQLIKENKIYIYIFSLSYMSLTNFSLSFSVLIYGLIYYMIRNFFYEQKDIKEKLKNSIIFLISNILSTLLILFHLYILLKIKKQTNLTSSSIIESNYIVSTLDLIKSLFYGTTLLTTELSGPTYPNIATNTIILISIFYFFINKEIKIRDKIFSLIGINIIAASIFIKNFDYILNMFHNTEGLTYRYSFIIIFLTITLFIHNSKTFNIKDKKKLLIISLILIILLLINYNNIEFNILIFNLIYIISYSILLIFYNNTKLYKILISLVLISQTLYASYISLPNETTKENLTYNNFITDNIKYRVNYISKDDFINKNLYTNEKATYLYSSVTYKPVLKMTNQLGCLSSNTSMTCHNNNTLFNMLFNVKNDYYLEKIYSVNKETLNVFLNETSVKKSQEDLIEAMTGITDIFTKETLTATFEDNKSNFHTDHSFYLIDSTDDNGFTYNYAQSYKDFTYTNQDTNLLESVDIYTISNNKLTEIYDILKQNQIEYTYYSDSHIEGTINVTENQIIFTSIPYDESWEITIDNKIVEPTMILESLIGIECEPGQHTITLKYKQNYTIPILISLCTLIGLIISITIKKNEN